MRSKLWLFSIALQAGSMNVASAHELSNAEIDGSWTFHDAVCLSGSKLPKFVIRRDSFATYFFDTRSRKMQLLANFGGGCEVLVENELIIDGSTIKATGPRILQKTCEIELNDNQPDLLLYLRKLPSGETALIIRKPPGDVCTENGIGEVILTRNRVG